MVQRTVKTDQMRDACWLDGPRKPLAAKKQPVYFLPNNTENLERLDQPTTPRKEAVGASLAIDPKRHFGAVVPVHEASGRPS